MILQHYSFQRHTQSTSIEEKFKKKLYGNFLFNWFWRLAEYLLTESDRREIFDFWFWNFFSTPNQTRSYSQNVCVVRWNFQSCPLYNYYYTQVFTIVETIERKRTALTPAVIVALPMVCALFSSKTIHDAFPFLKQYNLHPKNSRFKITLHGKLYIISRKQLLMLVTLYIRT